MFKNHLLNIYIYNDLTLNDIQWLLCHKTKPKQTKHDTTPVKKTNKEEEEEEEESHLGKQWSILKT